MKLRLHPGCLLRVQLRVEEGNHRGIELAMEGGAVEPRRIAASLWRDLRECRRAGRQEREVAGVRHHVIFGLCRQSVIYILRMTRMWQVLIDLAPPELDRRLDAGKSLRREQGAEGRHHDGGGDTRVVNEGGRLYQRSRSRCAGGAAPKIVRCAAQ